ncbi:MAG: hypothetical protein FJ108_11810, partial [Deltaproteobacteria bacterium]|nr:hypothetical protein [Deltaproteobacteria bacterium]
PGTGRYVSADPIGQAGGINVYRYARNNPLRFFDPLGLEEGSSANVRKRKAVADWAAGQSGATSPYDYGSYHSPQYPKDSYKCSAFTCDAAASGGAAATVTVPDGKGGTTTRCPTAAELARGNVPDWRTLKPGEVPEPGDIAAAPIPGGVDYTGHAAVATDDGAGGTTTVGAHHDQVGPPGADTFRSSPTYRRYTGD